MDIINNLQDAYLSFPNDSLVRFIPYNVARSISYAVPEVNMGVTPMEGFGYIDNTDYTQYTQYLCVVPSLICLICLCIYFYFN